MNVKFQCELNDPYETFAKFILHFIKLIIFKLRTFILINNMLEVSVIM